MYTSAYVDLFVNNCYFYLYIFIYLFIITIIIRLLTRMPPGQGFKTIVCWVVGCWSVGVGVCVCLCVCMYVFFGRVGPKGVTKHARWINC